MTNRTVLQMTAEEVNEQHNGVRARIDDQDQKLELRPSPLFVVEPSHGWISLRLWDLWEYRELLYFLVWRNVKVRYKQTALGAAWVVLQPFLTMVVFSVFFGNLGKIPSDGIPYPIFAYTA